VPFIPDDSLTRALEDSGVAPATAEAVLAENAQARLDGLRASLSVLALIALVALLFTPGVPTRQPGSRQAPDVPGAPLTPPGRPGPRPRPPSSRSTT